MARERGQVGGRGSQAAVGGPGLEPGRRIERVIRRGRPVIMQPVVAHRHPLPDLDGDFRLGVLEPERLEDAARQEVAVALARGGLERVAKDAVPDVRVVEALAGRETGLSVA